MFTSSAQIEQKEDRMCGSSGKIVTDAIWLFCQFYKLLSAGAAPENTFTLANDVFVWVEEGAGRAASWRAGDAQGV